MKKPRPKPAPAETPSVLTAGQLIAGLTALATIPKLRKARTISPEKATSGTRKVSAQLAQTRAAEARIMDACTARGIFPQRSRQPGAEDASMMPSTKSPNI